MQLSNGYTKLQVHEKLLVAFIINNPISHQSDESDLLKFVHSEIQICSDASEKKLPSQTDFYKPCP